MTRQYPTDSETEWTPIANVGGISSDLNTSTDSWTYVASLGSPSLAAFRERYDSLAIQLVVRCDTDADTTGEFRVYNADTGDALPVTVTVASDSPTTVVSDKQEVASSAGVAPRLDLQARRTEGTGSVSVKGTGHSHVTVWGAE